MFAPGGSITSAGIANTSASAVLSGTSMASPHVAGTAALHLANSPSATPADVATALINASTPNKVTNAGTGSPNHLLYTLDSSCSGTPPTITRFACPDFANSGGGMYWCEVSYSSASPATIRWPDGSANDYYSKRCVSGQRLSVTVTVTNAFGSVSRTSSTFNCPTGPIP